jgi:hypothetical protein
VKRTRLPQASLATVELLAVSAALGTKEKRRYNGSIS